MEAEKKPEFRVFGSTEELNSCLTEHILHVATAAIRERGSFSLVITGGIIKLLRTLARKPFITLTDWSKWHIYWAEENLVPMRDPDSLYRQTKEKFLSKVGILAENTNAIHHDLAGDVAANQYDYLIRQHVRSNLVAGSPTNGCPKFDLILFELNPEGHAAYLFPNHPALQEESKWVIKAEHSITMTLPVINAAKNLVIVASGSELKRPLLKVMRDPAPNGFYPVRMVMPSDGNLLWFVDSAASSLLLAGESPASSSAAVS